MTFTRLSDILAKQPRQLMTPKSSNSALRDEPGRVFQHELEPTRTTRPRKNLVAHHEKRDATMAAACSIADVWACRGEEEVER
jgi:hypothetical protein